MAHERTRQPEPLRDRAHRAPFSDTREHDAQARRVAKQAKQVGKRYDAVIRSDAASRIQWSRSHDLIVNI